jgi:hypothetical protein
MKLGCGGKYKGEFYAGKISGKGEMQWTNDDRYSGEWYDDKRHGTGTYYFANGDVYTGDFVEDIPHGYGTLTRQNTVLKKGFWDKGVCTSTSETLPQMNKAVSWSDSTIETWALMSSDNPKGSGDRENGSLAQILSKA